MFRGVSHAKPGRRRPASGSIASSARFTRQPPVADCWIKRTVDELLRHPERAPLVHVVDAVVVAQGLREPRTEIAALDLRDGELARFQPARDPVDAPCLALRALLDVEDVDFDRLTCPVAEGQIL